MRALVESHFPSFLNGLYLLITIESFPIIKEKKRVRTTRRRFWRFTMSLFDLEWYLLSLKLFCIRLSGTSRLTSQNILGDFTLDLFIFWRHSVHSSLCWFSRRLFYVPLLAL